MVLVQRLTGMRPGEVRTLTPADVDRSGPVWLYRPPAHKTAHRGKVRTVYVGPKAAAVLGPYLDAAAGPAACAFSPAVAMAERAAMRRAARKSPVQPSQADRRMEPSRRQRRPRAAFAMDSYNQCVQKAAVRAGVPPWSPNQARHLFATEVRARFGLEAAQVLLGHAKADTTQIYAERDERLAAKVAAEVG